MHELYLSYFYVALDRLKLLTKKQFHKAELGQHFF